MPSHPPPGPLERRARLLAAALGLSLLARCAPAVAPTRDVTIVADPGPWRSVEEAAAAEARVDWWDADPGDDDACTGSFAALELRRFLPACLGLSPGRVRVAAAVPDTGDVIVLATRGPRPSPVPLRGLAPPAQGFRIELERRDGRRLIVIDGGDRAGTLYGAYDLLGRLGARFYGLGDSGTVLPARPQGWPPRIAVSGTPAFTTRGFWAFEPRASRDFLLWMARNRLNLWTATDSAWVPLMKKLAIRLTAGGHDIQARYLDPRRYFPAHPEWYGWHAGKRGAGIRGESGDNFCTSNPGARRELAGNLVRALSGGDLRHADVLELWMLDQGRWCECDACRAQGSPTERLLALAAEVAGAMEEARRTGLLARPVEVATLAYLETLAPPGSPPPASGGARFTVTFFPYFRCYAHALDDPRCTEINLGLFTAYRGWTAATGFAPDGDRGVCEYYNVGAFKSLPLVFPHRMAADLARYRADGAREISYMHAPTRAWGSWTAQHAWFARLAWDPRADVDSLTRAFCGTFYPTTSGRMRAFYERLEDAGANIVALQHCAGVYGTSVSTGRLTSERFPLFPLRHLQEHGSDPAANGAASLDSIDHAMRQARAALDAATLECRDPAERLRLREDERRFAYGEAVFALYSGLIRTAAADRAGDREAARRCFEPAREAAERLRGVHDLVQVAASHANAGDGLEASGVRPTYEYFLKRYGR